MSSPGQAAPVLLDFRKVEHILPSPTDLVIAVIRVNSSTKTPLCLSGNQDPLAEVPLFRYHKGGGAHRLPDKNFQRLVTNGFFPVVVS